ncbi:MAG: hypothetical protein K2Q25_12325, partial [Mycobacteriaceae bacterium]|nr:hypothetical protein [Mycobacteriaceae bacterium]
PLSASYHFTLPVGTSLTCLSDESPGRIQEASCLRRTQCVSILLGWRITEYPSGRLAVLLEEACV